MLTDSPIKKPLSSAIQWAGSAVVILALTSCDWLGIHNPFSDDQRDKQVVAGTRHAPILNPDTVPPDPPLLGYVHGVSPPQIQPVREGIGPENYVGAKPPSAPDSIVNIPPAPLPAPAADTAAKAPEAAKNNEPVDADNNPYDYYDNEGNAPASTPSASSQSSQGSFFDRIFGSGNTRKPLPGNPPLPEAMPVVSSDPVQPVVQHPVRSVTPPDRNMDDDHVDIAPLPAPLAETRPVVIQPQAREAESAVAADTASPMDSSPAIVSNTAWQARSTAPKDNREPPVDSPNVFPTRGSGQASNKDVTKPLPEEPVETVAENDTEASQPSWFERMLGKYNGNDKDPARREPTPELSSVPPTPPQFETLKNERLQNMQDLQGDRLEAQQEKQQLDSEPSQQRPMVPHDMAPSSGGDASVNQPVSADQPVLLGHAATGTTPSDNLAPATPAVPQQ